MISNTLKIMVLNHDPMIFFNFINIFGAFLNVVTIGTAIQGIYFWDIVCMKYTYKLIFVTLSLFFIGILGNLVHLTFFSVGVVNKITLIIGIVIGSTIYRFLIIKNRLFLVYLIRINRIKMFLTKRQSCFISVI